MEKKKRWQKTRRSRGEKKNKGENENRKQKTPTSRLQLGHRKKMADSQSGLEPSSEDQLAAEVELAAAEEEDDSDG